MFYKLLTISWHLISGEFKLYVFHIMWLIVHTQVPTFEGETTACWMKGKVICWQITYNIKVQIITIDG